MVLTYRRGTVLGGLASVWYTPEETAEWERQTVIDVIKEGFEVANSRLPGAQDEEDASVDALQFSVKEEM